MIDSASIGDLFAQYDRALEELSAATIAERAANQAVRDARERASNLQKSIDNILETRRANPPWNTYWYDRERTADEAR